MVKADSGAGDSRGQRQTMLQRMGFNDPDLKCPDHDKMSFAMADPGFVYELLTDARLVPTQERIADMISKRSWTCQAPRERSILTYLPNDPRNKFTTSTILEHPICKGEGQYRVIIGYADAMINAVLTAAARAVVNRFDADEREFEHRTEDLLEEFKQWILVDAKPSIPNPMETLRQFNTYREHLPKTAFLLWCPPCPDHVADIFLQQGICVSCLPCP